MGATRSIPIQRDRRADRLINYQRENHYDGDDSINMRSGASVGFGKRNTA